jgi:hypothetical protein
MRIVVHVRYLLLLWDINEIWIFLTNFQKILLLNLTKTRPVGAELFHADGWTDIRRLTDRGEEANSCFSQFCQRAYNLSLFMSSLNLCHIIVLLSIARPIPLWNSLLMKYFTSVAWHFYLNWSQIYVQKWTYPHKIIDCVMGRAS